MILSVKDADQDAGQDVVKITPWRISPDLRAPIHFVSPV